MKNKILSIASLILLGSFIASQQFSGLKIQGMAGLYVWLGLLGLCLAILVAAKIRKENSSICGLSALLWILALLSSFAG